MSKEKKSELTVKLTVEQYKQTDLIEKYLLDNHIDIYCRTKRTHIKEWVLNQNEDEIKALTTQIKTILSKDKGEVLDLPNFGASIEDMTEDE